MDRITLIRDAAVRKGLAASALPVNVKRLARVCGISRQTMHRAFRPTARLSWRTLERLSENLDIPFELLVATQARSGAEIQ